MVVFNELGELGRLGNQLWQIAAVIGYARKNNMDFMFPPWKYFDSFEGSLPQTTQKAGCPTYTEPHFHYSDIPYYTHINLSGYFQAIQYWQHCEQEIRGMFTFKPEIIQRAQSFIDANRKGKIPVAVHQRYTDYITMGHYYHNLTPEWYMEAMNMFDPTTHHFFVMSDDINMAKQNTMQTVPVTFCGFDEITDLCIMSLCTHNIICNSSFSWWGSYLNKNPEKIVVAPNKNLWFKPIANHNVDSLYLPNWKLL